MTHNTEARVILAVANEADHAFVWEQLERLQTGMFTAGSVSIKFAYFGAEGALETRPCITTRWVTDSDDMDDLIEKGRTHCVCGCYVKISDIFAAALKENLQAPVQAVIVVGDAFHGDLDAAVAHAKELRAAGTRLFLLQQRNSPQHSTETEKVFRTLAEQTGGAYFHFNPAVERVAQRLPRLLEAVTHSAIGGTQALEHSIMNQPRYCLSRWRARSWDRPLTNEELAAQVARGRGVALPGRSHERQGNIARDYLGTFCAVSGLLCPFRSLLRFVRSQRHPLTIANVGKAGRSGEI